MLKHVETDTRQKLSEQFDDQSKAPVIDVDPKFIRRIATDRICVGEE